MIAPARTPAYRTRRTGFDCPADQSNVFNDRLKARGVMNEPLSAPGEDSSRCACWRSGNSQHIAPFETNPERFTLAQYRRCFVTEGKEIRVLGGVVHVEPKILVFEGSEVQRRADRVRYRNHRR